MKQSQPTLKLAEVLPAIEQRMRPRLSGDDKLIARRMEQLAQRLAS